MLKMAMLKPALLALSCALMLRMAQTNTVYRLPVQQSPRGFEKTVKDALPVDQLLPKVLKLPNDLLGDPKAGLSLSGHSGLEVKVTAKPGNQLELNMSTAPTYQMPYLGRQIKISPQVDILARIPINTNNGMVQSKKLISGDRTVMAVTTKYVMLATDFPLAITYDDELHYFPEKLTTDVTDRMNVKMPAIMKSVNNELSTDNANHQHQNVGHIGTFSNKVTQVSTERGIVESTVESQVQKPNGDYVAFTDSPMPELPPPDEKTEYVTAVPEEHFNALLASVAPTKLEVNEVFQPAKSVSVTADEPVQVTIRNGSITGAFHGTITIIDAVDQLIISYQGHLPMNGTASIKDGCIHLSLLLAGTGSLTVKEQHDATAANKYEQLKDKLDGVLKGKTYIEGCMMPIPKAIPAPKDIDKATATPMEGYVLFCKEKEDDASQ